MEKKFEYRGDLAVTPLPEILATIERYRVPGSLSIESGEVKGFDDKMASMLFVVAQKGG